MEVDDGWAPAECTLPTVERPLRSRDFDELFSDAVVAVDRVTPTELRLILAGGEHVAERARDLTARESECCSFFTFTFVVSNDDDRVGVDVLVPTAHVAALDAPAARAARRMT